MWLLLGIKYVLCGFFYLLFIIVCCLFIYLNICIAYMLIVRSGRCLSSLKYVPHTYTDARIQTTTLLTTNIHLFCVSLIRANTSKKGPKTSRSMCSIYSCVCLYCICASYGCIQYGWKQSHRWCKIYG